MFTDTAESVPTWFMDGYKNSTSNKSTYYLVNKYNGAYILNIRMKGENLVVVDQEHVNEKNCLAVRPTAFDNPIPQFLSTSCNENMPFMCQIEKGRHESNWVISL